MNCKQGDLAQIVRCTPDSDALLGALVRCDEFVGDVHGTNPLGLSIRALDAWRVTPLSPGLIAFAAGFKALAVSDRDLRPLPGDLTPETVDEEAPCTA